MNKTKNNREKKEKKKLKKNIDNSKSDKKKFDSLLGIMLKTPPETKKEKNTQ